MRRTAAALVAGGALALGLAACQTATVKTSASQTTAAKTTTTAKATTTAPVAKVGSTITLKTDQGTIAVTLQQVIDPAKSASQIAPDAGKRYVGAKFGIKATKGSYSGDSILAASVIASNGQTYSAGLLQVAGCTDFNNGQITLTPGESAVGCVIFQVPTAVKVIKVRYAGVAAGFPDQQIGEWQV